MLPAHSAFLQFQFSLASPYISRDDEIFHINDNPVRKDKVFKVPMVAGTSWKGNLRWIATHLLVLRWHETQDTEQLAEGRFRLTLLFGDEVGEGENRGLTKYLDELSAEAAVLHKVLEMPPPPVAPFLDSLSCWWQGEAADVCITCGVRPQGWGARAAWYKEKAQRRNVCYICLERRCRRAQIWAQARHRTGPTSANPGKGTHYLAG